MSNQISRRARKSRKLKKEKKANHYAISLAFSFIFFGLVFISYQLFIKNDFQRSKAYKKYKNQEVPASIVCMYGDEIKTHPTKSIVLDDDIYYVCCDKCLRKLEVNYKDPRMAIDLFSGDPVKKSGSYIRLEDSGSGKVNYFDSEENFYKFKNRIQ